MPESVDRKADVIVIGAGAVGASTAMHLARQGFRVALFEKEQAPARHQSGRNSGVIHAGYNLKPGSLKATFCVEGNRRLRTYCKERGIPLNEGGALVIARTEAELAVLRELKRRADANEVSAFLLEAREFAGIERHARGLEALHAPEVASFDAEAYTRAVLNEAETDGARVEFGVRVQAIDDEGKAGTRHVRLRCSAGTIEAAGVVNCAGLYADRLAGQLARDYRVIPFRGYYAELRPQRRDLVQSHIYSTPDLGLPFLGVHLSRRTDGRVIVGPGAMLAFGREAYTFAAFNLRDLWETVSWPGFLRLLGDSRFRALVRREVAKSLSLAAVCREAQLLVPELASGDLVRSYAGNRAQLVSRDGKLVDDIVVVETPRVLHVLNAVSPGLTCSLPFGEYLARRCAKLLASAS
jgi:L-2-hydroxyglutarate oxidase